MEQKHAKNKEYQTVRLFATLGALTLIAVLLFKVVLFGPTHTLPTRIPAEIIGQQNKAHLNTQLNTGINLNFISGNPSEYSNSSADESVND